LARKHNLVITRVGIARVQADALIDKGLDLYESRREMVNRVEEMEREVEERGGVREEGVGEGGLVSAASSFFSFGKSVAMVGGSGGGSIAHQRLVEQLAALTLETKQQKQQLQLLTTHNKHLQRTLLESKQLHDLETDVLVSETRGLQDHIATLVGMHDELTDRHEMLKGEHEGLVWSSKEELDAVRNELGQVTTHRDELVQRKLELESELGVSQTLHTDLLQNHDALQQTHSQLLDKHDAAEKEVANRTVYYEAQVYRLKAELAGVKLERDTALQQTAEAQEESRQHAARVVELDASVQTMTLQLTRAQEKYKKSRARELEGEIERLEQVVASYTAEVQFLKSLIKVNKSGDTQSSFGKASRSGGGWLFK
ncbi:hypothetical protein HDU98_005349, partial [Podochytrium sp. JEL0797]